MKKRNFVISTMGIVDDIDMPKVESILKVVRTNGNIVHMPTNIHSFKNKKSFVKEMTKRAAEMWDFYIEERAKREI